MLLPQRQAARDWLRHMDLSHWELGSLIGISRQQITNCLRAGGLNSFSRAAAADLRRLLAEVAL